MVSFHTPAPSETAQAAPDRRFDNGSPLGHSEAIRDESEHYTHAC